MDSQRVVMTLLLLLSLTIPFAPIGLTQVENGNAARISVYHWPDYVKQPPVEVIEMRVAGQKIVSGRPFSSPDAWLKAFSITIRNVSQKNIKYLRFRVEFPRDGKGNSLLNDVFVSGGQMFYFSPLIPRAGDDITVTPASTIDLMPARDAFSIAQAEVASKGMPNRAINFATISADIVLFDDNSGWISGNPVLRDRSDPSRWNADKNADVQTLSMLRRFLSLRSKRLFNHAVEEGSCYRFDSASSASCGGPGCTTVAYNLSTGSSGFNTKSRSEACSCGGTTATTDTDTNSPCGLLE